MQVFALLISKIMLSISSFFFNIINIEPHGLGWNWSPPQSGTMSPSWTDVPQSNVKYGFFFLIVKLINLDVLTNNKIMAIIEFFAEFTFLWYVECNIQLMMRVLVFVLRNAAEEHVMIVRDIGLVVKKFTRFIEETFKDRTFRILFT